MLKNLGRIKIGRITDPRNFKSCGPDFNNYEIRNSTTCMAKNKILLHSFSGNGSYQVNISGSVTNILKSYKRNFDGKNCRVSNMACSKHFLSLSIFIFEQKEILTCFGDRTTKKQLSCN